MENWLLAASVLIVASLLVSLVSRRITQVSGRNRSLSFMWCMAWAVVSMCAAFGISDLFGLSLPWSLLAAGVSGGVFGLLAQALAGRRAA